MVRKCIVCAAPQNRSSLLSFHRFPANKEVASKWLAACHLTENHIKKDTVICSKHFLIDDFDEHTSWPKRRLLTSAVPAPSLRRISTPSSFNYSMTESEQNRKTGTHTLQSNTNATPTSSILSNGITFPENNKETESCSLPSNINCTTASSSLDNGITSSEDAADVMEIDSKPDPYTLTQSLQEYISQLSKTDFNKVCRVCLALEETAFIISEVTYNNDNLWEILKNVVSIQMDHTDNLPKYICQSCTAALIEAYTFRQQFQQSDEILQTVMSKQNSISSKQDEDVANNKVAEESTTIISTENEASYLHPCLDVHPKQITLEANLSTEKEETQNQNIEDQVGIKIISCVSESKKAQFTCQQCNEIFNTSNELKAHRQKIKHPYRRHPRVCPVCGKSVKGIKQHIRTHLKEKPYFCHICNIRFTAKSSLPRHMLIHTGERPYTCDICGKGFTQSSSLVDHKRTHTGEKPFLCSYCGLGFVRFAVYKDHLNTKHQPNCGKDFINNKGSNIDEKTFVCNYCGMRFARLSRYNAHLSRKHHMNNGDSNNHNFNFECGVCKKQFTAKNNLRVHMLRHGERRLLCSYCGKRFVSKLGLRCHMTVHTGLKAFSCNICNKRFTQVGTMKGHMRIHTGEKPFICNVCSTAFKQRSQLRYHMRTHSGERPYVCIHCNKAFALKFTLTVHLRTHTKETPYICDVCGKGFYHSSTMKIHRRRHGQLEDKLINTSGTDTHK